MHCINFMYIYCNDNKLSRSNHWPTGSQAGRFTWNYPAMALPLSPALPEDIFIQ